MKDQMIITAHYLVDNPNHIFVFGDNLVRKGFGGAAKFRGYPNTYGFITKKYPNNYDSSFYRPEEYIQIFNHELSKLVFEIESHKDNDYLISKLGAGLANRYNIWEQVIKRGLTRLGDYSNVTLLWR